MRRIFFSSRNKVVRFRTAGIRPNGRGDPGPQERFHRVPGVNPEAYPRTTIKQVGAGGLGSATGRTFVRKGVRRLGVLDGDVVNPVNLGTQWFYQKDLYENKAVALARNLVREATGPTEILAYPMTFQEALSQGHDLHCDVLVALVDNNASRVAASVYGNQRQIPVVFAGVGLDGTHGYVFVQEPGRACFGCAFPDSISQKRRPCPGTPTCGDILQVLAGLVTYAVDTLIMARPRTWNYRTCCLSGMVPDGTKTVARRPECRLCGSMS